MNFTAIKNAFTIHNGWLVWLLRLAVGAVFIVSGMSKGLDIWGFVYKIEEYLQVWGIEQPHSMCLVAAMSIPCAEFLGGIALLYGCYRRTAVWLLTAIMAVMLPLTLYIYIVSPVPDCGCFGDFLILSNSATFWKNVAITLALIYLLIYNHKVCGIYHHYLQWMVLMAGFIYYLFVSLYGYMVQPMIDFRSFPIGANIITADGDEEDVDYNSAITFIYEKDGVQEKFSIESLPDSTWTFVSRIDANNDLLPDGDMTELTVYDDFGEDVTEDVISLEGDQLIITLPDFHRASPAYTYTINELERYVSRQGGSMIEIAAIPSEMLERWRNYSMAQYPIYRAEATTIKELARGTMAVVYIRDGVIIGKRNLGAVDPLAMEEDMAAGRNPLDELVYSDFGLFRSATATLVIFYALLYMLQSVIRIVRKHRRSYSGESQKND